MIYNLQTAQEYYENNMVGKFFVFETDKGRFVFKFEKSNFCHLIGLHHFNTLYQGIYGWNLIKNKDITHLTLKNINKNMFNNLYRGRIKVLYKTNKILENCVSIRSYKKIGKRNFNCDLFIYNDKDQTYDLISFFIDMKTRTYFAGASFMQFSKHDKYALAYINPLNEDIKIHSRFVTNNKIENNIDIDFLMNYYYNFINHFL